jgi:hypothetical protein
MGILSFIQRKLDRVLALEVFDTFRGNRPAETRLCQFGHAVFSGKCSYGHRAA